MDETNRVSLRVEANRTRRELLYEAGALAAGATALSLTGGATAFGRRKRRGQTVAIFGGGVAGLTAAHELAERGFDVTVYERRALGGKARSMPVPKTAGGPRRPLPGEHAWRSFFGFYRNLPETMKRIPRKRGGSVHDSLVGTDATVLSYPGGRQDLWMPQLPIPSGFTVDRLTRELAAAVQVGGRLGPADAAALVQKLVVYFTSCDERRFGQWETMTWASYIEAERHSAEYRGFFNLIPRAVALEPEVTSARTAGTYYESALLSYATGRGTDGSFDNVLKGPTSDEWIAPWAKYLRSLGVRFEIGQSVEELTLKKDRIVEAHVRGPDDRRRSVRADWFVCALPVEFARRLWSRPILKAAPQLVAMRKIPTKWCNGMQFYLRKPVPIAPGHVICVDSPWALSSVSHAQFWSTDFADTYGDGRQEDCLSVAIGEFDQPGLVVRKKARNCSPREFTREVWEQMKAYVNKPGQPHLRDEDLDSWFIDPGLRLSRPGRRRASNADTMFVNPAGGWEHRPDSRTEIPNLFLGADYVRTGRDAATMESANEAGRAAANGILDAASSRADRVEIRGPYEAPELKAAKKADQERFRRGQPNLFDIG